MSRPGSRPLRHAGLNAVFWEPGMGGMDTYVYELLPRLAQARRDVRFSLYLNHVGRAALKSLAWGSNVRLVTHPLLGRRPARALSEVTILARLAARDDVDLLHGLVGIGPIWTSLATVLTVHDITWLERRDSPDRLTGFIWRRLIPPAARRADRLTTVSAASRADIVRALGIPAERIDVVPNGRGTATVEPTPESELRRRFELEGSQVVLCVAAKKPHKNLLALVRALATVRERCPDAVLVLPGHPTPYEAELRAAAAQLGIGHAVRFVDYVDAHDLEGLYRVADCFAFPSLHEGFGMPVLEAMARDVPVACSRSSSLPEVAGEAAVYFDPHDEGDIARAVTEVLSSPELARGLVEAGRARQAQFTWERAAQAMIESYERALAARRRA